MKNLTRLIEFVNTKEFVLLSLIFSLIPQLFHSVMAFVGLSTPGSIYIQILVVVSGIFFALGVSLSILVQTLKGNQRMAYVYLFIELLINLVYYETYAKESIVLIVVQVLFALIMPVTIASYSHLMEQVNKEEEKVDKLKSTKQLIKESQAQTEQTVEQLFTSLNQKVANQLSIEDVKRYIASNEFEAENLENGKKGKIKIIQDEQEIDRSPVTEG